MKFYNKPIHPLSFRNLHWWLPEISRHSLLGQVHKKMLSYTFLAFFCICHISVFLYLCFYINLNRWSLTVSGTVCNARNHFCKKPPLLSLRPHLHLKKNSKFETKNDVIFFRKASALQKISLNFIRYSFTFQNKIQMQNEYDRKQIQYDS